MRVGLGSCQGELGHKPSRGWREGVSHVKTYRAAGPGSGGRRKERPPGGSTLRGFRDGEESASPSCPPLPSLEDKGQAAEGREARGGADLENP